MSVYDHYYREEDYFGAPHAELLAYLQGETGRILDVGCGQGRNAIPLARMGFEIVGLDLSKVGMEQMLAQAKRESLPITGQVKSIQDFEAWEQFDFLLFDSFFHFYKADRIKELGLLRQACRGLRKGGHCIGCFSATPAVRSSLNEFKGMVPGLEERFQVEFEYEFQPNVRAIPSRSPYLLRVWGKTS